VAANAGREPVPAIFLVLTFRSSGMLRAQPAAAS
jgi:hypothetical protein